MRRNQNTSTTYLIDVTLTMRQSSFTAISTTLTRSSMRLRTSAALVVAAWLVLVHSAVVLPPPPSTTVAMSLTSPELTKPRSYVRFHAIDSFLGMHIPCTDEEKHCFRHNTLYYPEEKRCLRKEDAFSFVGSRYHFASGRGHLFAVSLPHKDPCPGYRMAYDGRCYPKQIVRDVICGCDAEPTPHFLGGVECRCTPPTPIHVEQPQEEGRCRVPDLRSPDYARRALRRDPNGLLVPLNFLSCTVQQAVCFNQGKVAINGACVPLHHKGPCPKDHVVALDAQSALSRRAESTCVHVRDWCPPGQKRMAFDRRCYEDKAVDLFRPGNVLFTIYGENVMIGPERNISTKLYLSTLIEIRYHFRVCTVEHVSRKTKWMEMPLPNCAPNAKDLCFLFNVQNEPPLNM